MERVLNDLAVGRVSCNPMLWTVQGGELAQTRIGEDIDD
jgi:hypothetical protein